MTQAKNEPRVALTAAASVALGGLEKFLSVEGAAPPHRLLPPKMERNLKSLPLGVDFSLREAALLLRVQIKEAPGGTKIPKQAYGDLAVNGRTNVLLFTDQQGRKYLAASWVDNTRWSIDCAPVDDHPWRDPRVFAKK